MPLPWKKPKVGRISRLVADLQHSPKHGGSLVVETGFPTSLIDLFVKNRDRLKKKTSNKHQQTAQPQPQPQPPPPSPPSPPRRSSSPPPDPPAPQVEKKDVRFNTEEKSAGLNADSRDSGGGDGHGGGRSRVRGGWVFMVVVKIFVVMVLALSTKKLTVAITLSAFALLLLEFTVARAFTLFKLCPDAQVRLDSLIEKVLGKRPHGGKQIKMDDKNVISCEITESFEDSTNCAEGIRAPDESYKEASSCPEPESAVDSKKSKLVEEGGGERETIRDLLFKNERSRSSKLKSKIVKKLVPKKLRSCKKKRLMKMTEEKEEEDEEESLTEASSIVSDDKFEKIEEEISERDDVNKSNRESLAAGMKDFNNKPKIISKGNDKEQVMILVMVVLAGLLGGKALAIVVSLLWCLVPRFRRENPKV